MPCRLVLGGTLPRLFCLARVQQLCREPARAWAKRWARAPALDVCKLYLTLNPGVLYSTPARARQLLFSANASEEEVASCVRRLGPESFRAFLDMTFSPPRVEGIRSGHTPLLVLGAAEDALVTPDEIENTARAYDASSRMFSRLGHDMMLEAGWEQVATHVVEWLETQKL